MSDPELRGHYQILDLEEGASLDQVKAQYLHLKALYSTDSPLFHCLGFTLPDPRKREILSRIHRAYFTLREHHARRRQERKETTRDTVQEQRIPEFEHYNGDALRLTRDVLGLSLEEVAFACGIPLSHLRHIEADEFDRLPPKGYVRLYLRKYAGFMCLDPERVVKDYLAGYPETDKDRQ